MKTFYFVKVNLRGMAMMSELQIIYRKTPHFLRDRIHKALRRYGKTPANYDMIQLTREVAIRYNTMDEIDRTISILEEIIREQKAMVRFVSCR